jgi:hypothetical protein
MKISQLPETYLANALDEARHALSALYDQDAPSIPVMTAGEWAKHCHTQVSAVRRWLVAPSERREMLLSKLNPADKGTFLLTILSYLRAARMALDANRCGRTTPLCNRDRADWILDWANTATTLWEEGLHPLYPYDATGRVIVTDRDPNDLFEITGFGAPGRPTTMQIVSSRGVEHRVIEHHPKPDS